MVSLTSMLIQIKFHYVNKIGKKMKNIILIILFSLTLSAAPRVGDDAVKFNLPHLYNENSYFSNNEMKGKVVLLNLWASWCSGCQEEMPLFVDLQSRYSKSKFLVVTSSIDNVAQSAIDFLDRVDTNRVLTSLYDIDKILPKSYRCPGMPSSFLIDKNGKIVEVYIGSLDEDGIKKLTIKIQSLLGE